MAAGERLRASVQARALPHAGNKPGVVTVTIGVATADEMTSPMVTRERAAAAVDTAKLNFERNRVHLAEG